jgi:hypothetical protein
LRQMTKWGLLLFSASWVYGIGSAHAQTFSLCCPANGTCSQSTSGCPDPSANSAEITIPMTQAVAQGGAGGATQVITSAPFHGQCFLPSDGTFGTSVPPTWCLEVSGISGMKQGGIVSSSNLNLATTKLSQGLAMSIGATGVAGEVCYLPGQGPVFNGGGNTCTDLGGYCCTPKAPAGSTPVQQNSEPVPDLVMQPLPACNNYNANGGTFATGTGVEASPNSSTGSCPSGQVNTGSLRDSQGNFCCSAATVPALPLLGVFALGSGLVAARAKVLRARRKAAVGA